MDEKIAAKLREQFPAEHVGKLPRVTCRACSNSSRGECDDHHRERCGDCGNYISTRHIHLDYVGHADVTSRLIEADPGWNWEPRAEDEHGLPLFDTDAKGAPVGLWIRLTVGGVSRLGYGSCPSGQNDAVKVLIGDALRNAAMRFGVALDLWAKGDRADPTAENATASGGQAVRRNGQRQERAGDGWDSATPARPQNGQRAGNGGGTVSRPAANGAKKGGPTEADIDPEVQTFFDEAHQARTVKALGEVHTRAREAGKLSAIGRNPATGGIGGFGAYSNWRRKELQDTEAAWNALQEAAVQMSTGELEAHVQMVTGAGLEGATAAQLREAAAALKAGAPV